MMNVIDVRFYKKGVSVVLESPAIDPNTFAASLGKEEIVGYVPSSDDKEINGSAGGSFEKDGKSYLALKVGYVYDVLFTKSGTEYVEVISAEHDNIVIAIPDGVTVKVKKHKEDKA